MLTVGANNKPKTLDELRNYYIETERDEQVLHQLNRLLKMDECGSHLPEPIRFAGNLETRGVALIEAAGGGKTTAVNRVLSRHPALQARPGEEYSRYLRIQVPSPATLKSLGREVLIATGLADVSPRATAWEIWRTVRHRLTLLDIVVLWFDEAQDMFLSGSAREIDDMLKMLKSLMQGDSAVIPILSGTERLSEITNYDPQVNRRFTKVVPKPLALGVDDSTLLELINLYCSDIDLKLDVDASLPSRLIYASRRRFGRAVETILNAIEYAVDEKSESLTSAHFAVAWGMQEGCEWDENVFVAVNWAAIELDAGAEDFEVARTERQSRQAGKKVGLVMMHPYLPPLSGESLISWVNRFGLFHCGLSLPNFLSMISLSQLDLVKGRKSVLTKMADISGVSNDVLEASIYTHMSKRSYCYQGEEFYSEFIARNRVTFCPACFLAEIEAGENGLKVGIGRLNWAFIPVRTCRIHNISLHRNRGVEQGKMFLDAPNLAPDQEGLKENLRQSKSRKPSRLQNYVENRLANGCGPEWLDKQQIDLAARATEMLGACIEFGAHVSLPKLTEDDWNNAGEVGYDFTSRGEEGIREGLENIYRKPQRNPSQSGPQGAFGKLYQWAQFKKNDKPIGPFQDVLREYILDTHPLQPGTNLFGEAVEECRRHSVASLSSKYGVHAKTVANVLMNSGLLDMNDDPHGGRCTVPAKLAEELVGKLKRAIPITKIPKYIGCSRTQAILLVKDGIINPVIPEADNARGRHKGVDARDLDQLIEQMRQFGRPVERPGLGMATIGETVKALHAPSMDILSLLLDRRLENVELLPEEMKFQSVLVNKQEIALKLGSQTGKSGVTISEAAREIRAEPDVVRLLFQASDDEGQPVLRSCGQVRHMGIMRDLIDPDSLDNFKRRYRKLSMIKGYWVCEPDRLRQELKARGIRPAWDPNIVGAEIYRVSDL